MQHSRTFPESSSAITSAENLLLVPTEMSLKNNVHLKFIIQDFSQTADVMTCSESKQMDYF